MKLKDEQQDRRVDPFELQVFQEALSAKLNDIEKANKVESEKLELDVLSKAPNKSYGSFNKMKKQKK